MREFNALWFFEATVGGIILLFVMTKVSFIVAMQIVACWFMIAVVFHLIMISIRLAGFKWPDKIMLKNIKVEWL